MEKIDAIGLLCPLPVLKLRKRMAPLAPGAEVELCADDPAAMIDVPHFCNEAGHTLVSVDEAGAHSRYRVRKGG
ncbi:preprotein translocase subunit TatB [Pelagivirga sediminicola]|uniref:Preprotein translocase subunit TatB n=1 Tax=Pelagivirga sediminicola TaxID=2170575 RepID=A0A2T7GBQ5_9RHOB|nr:sulfurtransferase TusA family protein [Pelagivirga sediminicola]PVA11843.1 preprotein translocase subunit TatB [Pelagivirga sediminicola]